MSEKYYLGLNYIGHDASASILKDGELLASAMEERFTREKKSRDFPIKAIQSCLKQTKLSLEDIDIITFYFDTKLFFEKKLEYIARYYPRSMGLAKNFLDTAYVFEGVKKEIREKLDFLGEIYFCDHHKAHIASTYFLSNFKEDCAFISIDGLGESKSTVLGEVKDNQIHEVSYVEFPHSLGLLYNALTHYLGFNAISDAGKVMGLSSYGDPEVFINDFRKIVSFGHRGTFKFDLDYFAYPFMRNVWISNLFEDKFGKRRIFPEELNERYENVAAGLQTIVEETFDHMCKFLNEEYDHKNLCLAGGVALNSVSNGKLIEKGYFKNIFIPPACGDDGLSFGAPLYHNFCVRKRTKRYPLKNAFMGYEYTDEEMLRAIQKFNFRHNKPDDICEAVARLVSSDNIVGWYQGRMEMGPRALGNRSILANPMNPNMKDIVNSRVKFREPFRPFAPSVLREHSKEWFEVDYPAPYMLFVFKVKEDKRKLVPAITHVDGTGRLQTVTKEFNPKYHKMIDSFRKITGVPMILNTSFNIKGEPIVESPTDAIRCFLGNGIDYLALGNYLVKKESF